MDGVLVTGGAGFVGVSLVGYLVRATDARITVLDKLTSAASREALEGLPADRVRLVVGDVCDAPLVDRLVAEQAGDRGAVVHLAAETHNDAALRDPSTFVTTNLVGTFTVLEAVRRHDVHLHHVSTDEVFGDLALDDPTRFTESAPYRPSSPYSATKAGADHLVRAWVRSFGVRATVSICSNNYGPWQHVEKFIPRQVTNILDGGRAEVYGTGANVRDWIHVDDHASAVWEILQRGTIGSSYLIGADGQRTNREVVRLILRQLGRDPDDLDQVGDRPGHDLRYALDASRLRTELGWAPQHTSFEDGLAETIEWYQDHAHWWRPRKAAVEAAHLDGMRMRAQGTHGR